MDGIAYVLIAIGYVVYTVIKAANKNKKKQGTPPANGPQPTQKKRSVFDILREEIERQNNPQQTPPQQVPQQRKPAPAQRPMIRDPFLEPEAKPKPKQQPVRELEADHFSEAKLVEEFRRTHAQGKTIKHHTHDYFDEKKDGSKSRHQMSKKRKHPIGKMLKGKKNAKMAIALREVLDRKF